MRQLKDAAEAAGFYLLIGLFRLLGRRGGPAVGGWLARTLGPLVGRHREALARLERAMPELTETERKAVLLEMWDNLGRVFAEYPFLGRFTILEPDPNIEIVGRDRFERFASPDAGAIFLSGHFANWELMPLVAAQAGIDAAEVYRAPNNKAVDAWITAQRQRHVLARQIPKSSAGARELVRCVRNKVSLCILADQKMNDGIESTFFGRPAMTPAAPATLAVRYGVPIVPVALERLGRASRFRLHIGEPMEAPATGDFHTDVARTTDAINRYLETQIRARPGQWLWLHRRWSD